MAKFEQKVMHEASENAYSYWLHVRDLGYGKKQAGVMTQSKRTIYFFGKSYKYQAFGKRISSMAKIFHVTGA